MNNSIHVNSVDVPDSDVMATNGVIHVVKNVLYPAGEKQTDNRGFQSGRQASHKN